MITPAVVSSNSKCSASLASTAWRKFLEETKTTSTQNDGRGLSYNLGESAHVVQWQIRDTVQKHDPVGCKSRRGSKLLRQPGRRAARPRDLAACRRAARGAAGERDRGAA